MESTWAATIDLRVLEAAVQYMEDNEYGKLPQAYDLAPSLKLSPEELGKSLLRLQDEYIDIYRPGGGLSNVGVQRIRASARRAIGQWPTAERVATRIIQDLDSAAETERDPEQKARLKQTAAFLGSSGKDLLINILASVIAKGTGLG
jgi:hypothetical protein